MLKKLETFPKVTIKHIIRVHLRIILKNDFSTSNDKKILSIKNIKNVS